jgi:hypothetical protein
VPPWSIVTKSPIKFIAYINANLISSSLVVNDILIAIGHDPITGGPGFCVVPSPILSIHT